MAMIAIRSIISSIYQPYSNNNLQYNILYIYKINFLKNAQVRCSKIFVPTFSNI